jgi:methyl-accepting chemotaxis protein
VKSVNVITESIEDVNGQKDLITEKISMLNDIASDNAASSEETSSVALELEQTVATSSEKVHVLADSARQLVESLKRFTL